MNKNLNKVVHYLNQDHQKHLSSFSGMILKETLPAVILIEDHIRRDLPESLCLYPEFIAEMEGAIFQYLIDARGEKESEDPTEIFIAKAQLYSPYHYLVTFL